MSLSLILSFVVGQHHVSQSFSPCNSLRLTVSRLLPHSVCLFASPSVCLSVCLFVCMSVYLSVCLSVQLSTQAISDHATVVQAIDHNYEQRTPFAVYEKHSSQNNLRQNIVIAAESVSSGRGQPFFLGGRCKVRVAPIRGRTGATF